MKDGLNGERREQVSACSNYADLRIGLRDITQTATGRRCPTLFGTRIEQALEILEQSESGARLIRDCLPHVQVALCKLEDGTSGTYVASRCTVLLNPDQSPQMMAASLAHLLHRVGCEKINLRAPTPDAPPADAGAHPA